MVEPWYTPVLQGLHVGGGWLAFGAAPLALGDDRLDRLLAHAATSSLAAPFCWR